MIRMLFASLVAGTLLLTLPGCEKSDPPVENEEEVITTLVYELTPQGGGTSVRATFTDLDGDGGNPPTITDLVLQSNTTYNGVITLFNEQAKPTESVHEEVKDEADEHQFFFPNTLNQTTIGYADQDSNGKPLGLKTTLTTTGAESGKLTVVLKHEPTKTSNSTATDDGTAAGGETDIEVTFNVSVQ